MPVDSQQERSLQQNLRTARIVAAILSFVMPTLFLLTYGIRVLHGHFALFLNGFAAVPWHNPIVMPLIGISAVALGAAAFLPERIAHYSQYQHATPFGRLKIKHILVCVFLEYLAVFGMLLGILGPDPATLALLLFCLPMAGGILMFPNEAKWREQGRL